MIRILCASTLCLVATLGASSNSWGYPYDICQWRAPVSGGADLCQTGQAQSPINLPAAGSVSSTSLQISSYTDTSLNIAFSNNGHTLKIAKSDGTTFPGRLSLDGGAAFELLQVHFHQGSEHFIRGVQQRMEVHLVHRRVVPSTEYAVIGIFFTSGAATNDTFLSWWLTQLGNQDSSGRSFTQSEYNYEGTATIPLSNILGGRSLTNYWQYPGSFTTPPCTEGVNWRVLHTVNAVSEQQLQAFAAAFDKNFRPPAQLHGRTVSGGSSDFGPALPNHEADDCEDSSDDQAGLIAGLVTGLTILLLLTVVICVYYRRRRASESQFQARTDAYKAPVELENPGVPVNV